jgi:hypothetical protein
MKITDEVGQAEPESGNATRFIWWLFTCFPLMHSLKKMPSEMKKQRLFLML